MRTSTTTRIFTTSFRLNATGTQARGQIYVCAHMGFPVPDSCSDAAYPSFSY